MTVLGERGLVGVGEMDLANGGGGLFLIESRIRLASLAESGSAHGDGAGGDDDHLGTARALLDDIFSERREPGLTQAGAGLDE